MLWLVPTRERPGNAERLIQAFVQTKSLEYTELLFIVDEDDPQLDAYEELFLRREYDDYGWLGYAITEQRGIRDILNYHATRYAMRRSHIGFMGDDHLPRTPGWDLTLLNRMVDQGPVCMAYTNDLLQGPNLPTLIMMTSNIIRALGHMVPGTMQHLYIDNAWKRMGEIPDILLYLGDVVIEHMHPVARKAEWDERYAVNNSGERYEQDENAFHAWIASGLDDTVQKINTLRRQELA